MMWTQSKLREYSVFEGITRLLDFALFMEMPTVNFYCLKRTLGEGVINQEVHVRKRAFGKRLSCSSNTSQSAINLDRG